MKKEINISNKGKNKLAFFGVKYFPSNGGVSRTTENLIRNLKDKFDITIYCYKNPIAHNYIGGVHTVQFPEIPLGSFGVFIHFLTCYFHMMIFRNYDIIHLRKIDAAFFIPLLMIKYKRVVASSHESSYVRDKWGIIAKLYFKMNERIFIYSKARLTAISKPLCDYYKIKYNRDVIYIPNGVEINRNFENEDLNKYLNQQVIEMPYLFFGARRIMATKGCHTMIEALNILELHMNVLVAGEMTHAKSYISDLIRQSSLLNVKYIGYVSSKSLLLALIKGATFFIFPSETEGMSIMLLEVASTGTPLICSDIPENTEVFSDEEVLYFKNKDAHDLANKLKWALENQQIMKDKAKKAYDKLMSCFSGDIMSQRYEQIYNETLSL